MISPEEHLNCKVHDRRGCAHRDTSLSSARSESPNARVITPELWRNRICIRYAGASTSDQLLYSALHGTAMRYAAERRNLDESIEELRQIADGRNDIFAEAAGITAGSWYASPATHVGYELIGAAMLILAGGGRGFPLDYDELERWTRIGFERGMRSREGER
jgi:hypothetical protein